MAHAVESVTSNTYNRFVNVQLTKRLIGVECKIYIVSAILVKKYCPYI